MCFLFNRLNPEAALEVRKIAQETRKAQTASNHETPPPRKQPVVQRSTPLPAQIHSKICTQKRKRNNPNGSKAWSKRAARVRRRKHSNPNSTRTSFIFFRNMSQEGYQKIIKDISNWDADWFFNPSGRPPSTVRGLQANRAANLEDGSFPLRVSVPVIASGN